MLEEKVGCQLHSRLDLKSSLPSLLALIKNSACKSSLPIVAAITKTTTLSGKHIILQSLHIVYNASLPHSLLSDYEMCEAGFIVDNVSKCHRVNDNGILKS